MMTRDAIEFLSGAIDRGSTVVVVDIMQNALVEEIVKRRSDLKLLWFLSAELLLDQPDFAPVALMAIDSRNLISTETCECRVQHIRKVDFGPLLGRETVARCGDFGQVVSGLRNVSLLYLSACPGHDRLLLHILPVLSSRGVIVWWTLSEGGSEAERQVLDAAASHNDFSVFQFDAGGTPLFDGAEDALALVLLVPRAAWTSHGLDEFGAVRETDALRLVPASRGHCADLLERLPAMRTVRLAQPPFEKRFLEVGSHVLADAGEIVEQDKVRYLRVGRRRTVTFAFTPPAAGVFDVGIVVGNRTSGSHAASLRVCVEETEARLTWVEDWFQLRISMPFVLEPGLGPATFALRDLRPADGPSEHLLIKGIEIAARQQAHVAALRPPAMCGQVDRQRLAS